MEAVDVLPLILIALGLLALLEASYSLKGGLEFHGLFRSVLSKPPGDFTPPVTLIVPCKGVDPGLELNLNAYFELDYPDFQLLLVMGESSDPCLPVLECVRKDHLSVKSRILFSGKAHKRAQKVHNLLHALTHARAEDQVFAFGDSDIRPARDWLRRLVSLLEDPNVGISTGFRWYLPQAGNFASVLRSVWNAGAASLMKQEDCYFAWGGAMAVRRRVFDACRVTGYWENTVSDDYAISRAVHDHSLSIRFQPHCLSFTFEDCGLKELLNWTHRQLSITRVYHPWLWNWALGTQLVNSLTLWGGAAVILTGWGFYESPTLFRLASLVSLVYALGCLKGWLRIRAVLIFFPEQRPLLNRFRRAYIWGGPLASLLSLYGLIRSLLNRDIEWRGIRYRMLSSTKTEVLN